MAGISRADASQVRVDMAQIDSSQIVSADEFRDLVIPGNSFLGQVGDYAPNRLSLTGPSRRDEPAVICPQMMVPNRRVGQDHALSGRRRASACNFRSVPPDRASHPIMRSPGR